MARRLLLTAAACAVLASAVYVAAVRVSAVEEADLRTLNGFVGLWTVPGGRFAGALLSVFDPVPFALLAAGLLACAAAAGRTRAGLLASAALVGANVTSQVLKPLLAVQRDFPAGHFIGPEAYPSGHATAAMSFALALAIVVPPRLRPHAAVVGALLIAGTAYSILILASHYPSDVIGGFLVATAWACVAVLSGSGRAPRAVRRRRSLRG